MRDEILRLVTAQPMWELDLVKATGANIKIIRRILGELRTQRVIQKAGGVENNGRWFAVVDGK